MASVDTYASPVVKDDEEQNDSTQGQGTQGEGTKVLADKVTVTPQVQNTDTTSTDGDTPEGFVKTQSEIDADSETDPVRKEQEETLENIRKSQEEQEKQAKEQADRDAKWQEAMARYQSLFADASDKVARGTNLTPEEEKKERKKERITKAIAGIGDMINAFSNLGTTAKWAPNIFDPQNTMSDAMFKRYEDLRKERREKAKQYYDAVLNRYKADAQIQRMEDDRAYKRSMLGIHAGNLKLRAEDLQLKRDKEDNMRGFRDSMAKKNYAEAERKVAEMKRIAESITDSKEKTKAYVEYYNALAYLNGVKANKEKKGTTTFKIKQIKKNEDGSPMMERGKYVYDEQEVTIVNGSPEEKAMKTAPYLKK